MMRFDVAQTQHVVNQQRICQADSTSLKQSVFRCLQSERGFL